MEVRDEIARLKGRLDALRPFDPRSVAALDRWYDVELTYTSNAIEGSTLSRSETAVVVEKGLTVGGKPLRFHLDALGHMDALGFVRALAAEDRPLREGEVREIHRLVLGRTDPEEAGHYSRHQRLIAGSSVRFLSPAEIGPAMRDFALWLGSAEPGADTAFEAHFRLVTVHPFSGGNGRTARLLMNLLLLRSGYPPVAIGPEERARYLDALERRQLGRPGDGWSPLMHERLRASLLFVVDHVERGRVRL